MRRSSASGLKQGDNRILKMLRMAPFERRKNGWRFGTKRIADHVVERIIAAGRAAREGDIVRAVLNPRRALHRDSLQAIPYSIAPDPIGLVVISAPSLLDPAIDAPLNFPDQAPVVAADPF
jgi:hypothetical protein